MWQQVEVSIFLDMQSEAFCILFSKPFYRQFIFCMSNLANSLNINLNDWLFLTRSFHN